jgi:RNA polymerase subunit RPABC4/transcription elongation factor Spt4
MTEPNRQGSNTGLFLVLGLIGLCFLIFGTHGCLRHTLGIGWGGWSFNNWGMGWWGPFGRVFSLWSVWALLSVVLAVWVGSDANRRGMNGLLWGLLVFFTSVVGLLIYLIVAEGRNGTQRAAVEPAGPPPPAAVPATEPAPPPATEGGAACRTCGTSLQADFKVCPNCGAGIGAACRSCARPLEAEWKVCPYCGTGVAGP